MLAAGGHSTEEVCMWDVDLCLAEGEFGKEERGERGELKQWPMGC